jgi:tellurite resistance protein TerC
VTTIATTSVWAVFAVFVLAALAVDLLGHRRDRDIRFGEALGWSVLWVALALVFNGFVYVRFGREPALQFLTGYLVEKSLSVDNIFVFVVLFQAFAVPPRLQHRVLFWGIVGAVLMRAVFIFAGAALLARFHWVMYVFGAILIVTGARLLVHHGSSIDFRRNPLFRRFAAFVPLADDYAGNHFFVRSNGRRMATPLLAALVAIESIDVVFAIDSIPAIFAITEDPFLVFTSNIFAILGLRAMFFLIGDAVLRFRYLSTGLACVLMFIGLKMLVAGFVHVPILVSLGVIVAVIGGALLLSAFTPSRSPRTPSDVSRG